MSITADAPSSTATLHLSSDYDFMPLLRVAHASTQHLRFVLHSTACCCGPTRACLSNLLVLQAELSCNATSARSHRQERGACACCSEGSATF